MLVVASYSDRREWTQSALGVDWQNSRQGDPELVKSL
jgi:hypothetical protein